MVFLNASFYLGTKEKMITIRSLLDLRSPFSYCPISHCFNSSPLSLSEIHQCLPMPLYLNIFEVNSAHIISRSKGHFPVLNWVDLSAPFGPADHFFIDTLLSFCFQDIHSPGLCPRFLGTFTRVFLFFFFLLFLIIPWPLNMRTLQCPFLEFLFLSSWIHFSNRLI